MENFINKLIEFIGPKYFFNRLLHVIIIILIIILILVYSKSRPVIEQVIIQESTTRYEIDDYVFCLTSYVGYDLKGVMYYSSDGKTITSNIHKEKIDERSGDFFGDFGYDKCRYVEFSQGTIGGYNDAYMNNSDESPYRMLYKPF